MNLSSLCSRNEMWADGWGNGWATASDERSGHMSINSSNEEEPPPLLDGDSDLELVEPCNHNKWDNLRTKREIVSLRCRVCSSQWKAPLEFLRERKCAHFVKTCPIVDCTDLHIFKYKLPAKTRTKILQQQFEQFDE